MVWHPQLDYNSLRCIYYSQQNSKALFHGVIKRGMALVLVRSPNMKGKAPMLLKARMPLKDRSVSSISKRGNIAIELGFFGDLPAMTAYTNTSPIGRLLEELSWMGRSVKAVRGGGRGNENVLTVEALQGLDFLPRKLFLGEVIRAAHGADAARQILIQEIEQAELKLLPGNHYLIPSATRHQVKLPVQPDILIETDSCYVLGEVKRIRRSSFQPEQLSREFVLLMREAQGTQNYPHQRIPLMFLILGSEPPVAIDGHGRLDIADGIKLYLESVLKRAEDHDFTAEELLEKMPEAVAWITWQEIRDVVNKQVDKLELEEESIASCIQRLARSVTRVIEWHN